MTASRDLTVGIMQGRLLPPVNGRIQAFPARRWGVEFDRAAELGFDTLEFIFESTERAHPLTTPGGLRRIRERIRDTGVEVRYVLADYFMERPLFLADGAEADRLRDLLVELVSAVAALGGSGIEIPFVDRSSLPDRRAWDRVATLAAPCLERASACDVTVGLELDLPPDETCRLLRLFDHPVVRVAYDSGNSAALGYDVGEEMDAYGDVVDNLHLKDRRLGGGTVPLGTGAADLGGLFGALADRGWRGSVTVQGARGSDDLRTAREYLALTHALVEQRFPADG